LIKAGLPEIVKGLLSAGDDGGSGGKSETAGGGFRTHAADHLGGRADENDAGGGASLGKFRIFAQEAVTRMDGLDAVAASGVQDLAHVKVALRGRRGAEVSGFIGEGNGQGGSVGVGIDRDAAHSEFPESADKTDPYLSAVGYQYLGEHAVDCSNKRIGEEP
jgi:hypothetical protein